MDEDRIINKLTEIDEKVSRLEENMATKFELRELNNNVMTHLDEQIVILKRLDEERHYQIA